MYFLANKSPTNMLCRMCPMPTRERNNNNKITLKHDSMKKHKSD